MDEAVRAEYSCRPIATIHGIEASRDRNYEEELRDLVPLALASRERISGGGRITVEELTKLMT